MEKVPFRQVELELGHLKTFFKVSPELQLDSATTSFAVGELAMVGDHLDAKDLVALSS